MQSLIKVLFIIVAPAARTFVDSMRKLPASLRSIKPIPAIALKITINESKTVQRLVQKERKACREFNAKEIKDCETMNMAT